VVVAAGVDPNPLVKPDAGAVTFGAPKPPNPVEAAGAVVVVLAAAPPKPP
jgi:hypothetical protein